MTPSQLLARPIAFHRVLVDVAGSIEAALFLGQALYWSRTKKDGWFWKTRDEWTDETALSRYQQEHVRKILRDMGVLEEREERLEHRLYYRVNEARLDAILAEAASGNVSISPPGRQETDHPEGEKLTSGAVSMSPPSSCTETTTETTSNLLAPTASERRDGKKRERKPKAEPSERGLKFADWFRKQLPADVRLEGKWRDNWARCFDDMERLDTRTRDEIVAVCTWARKDDFWKANFMSPLKLREKKHGVMYFDLFLEKASRGTGRNGHNHSKPSINYLDPSIH